MRKKIALAICFVFGLGLGSAFASRPRDSALTPIKVRAISLISTDLPSRDRKRIQRSFTRQSYVAEELRARILLLLKSDGYFRAVVDEPKLTQFSTTEVQSAASFSFRITCGPRYHLEGIRLTATNTVHPSVFPPSQLRSQFRIRDNAIFDESSISRGFENLRQFYLDRGYADFVAIPHITIDEAHHAIDLLLEIDQGYPFSFGRLFLDGIEPHAGDAARLLAGWRSMQGSTYSPEVLDKWVAEYAPSSTYAGGATPHTSLIEHAESRTIDVRLQLPWTRDGRSGWAASSDHVVHRP